MCWALTQDFRNILIPSTVPKLLSFGVYKRMKWTHGWNQREAEQRENSRSLSAWVKCFHFRKCADWHIFIFIAPFLNLCLIIRVCTCAWVHADTPGGQKRISHPRSWSYRSLWATIWMLGPELTSSVRAANALGHSHLSSHFVLLYF